MAWPLKRIDEIADVNPRLNKAGISDDLSMSFVPMPAVGAADGEIDVSHSKLFEKVRKGFTAFAEGDVLFAKITPCMENGKMAVVPKVQNGYGFGSTEFHVLRPKSSALARYIYYFVSSKRFRGEAERYMTGAVGQKRVPTTYLKEQKIPAPEIDQQKRIVEEIEKQFSRLDEAVANLKRVKANLKRYKASVLQAAVTGKLTEEWRKQNLPAPVSQPSKFYTYAILCEDDSIYIGHTNDIERRWREHREGQGAEWKKKHQPVKIAHYEAFDSRQEVAEREKWLKTGFGRKWLKRELAAGRTRQAGDVEPASKLLERILTERRQKWEEKYKEPVAPDVSGLPELPDEWVWFGPEQLASTDKYSLAIGPFGSNLKVSDYVESGVPLVFVRNIRSESFSDGKSKFISKSKAEKLFAHSINGGDILITKMGEPPGEACIYPENLPMAVITADCIKWAISTEIDNKRFIVNALNSQLVAIQIAKITKGVAQQKISLARFKSIALPLPSAEEQHVVVQEIESRLSVAEKIENAVDVNLLRAERLRQSILKQAFSGKLV